MDTRTTITLDGWEDIATKKTIDGVLYLTIGNKLNITIAKQTATTHDTLNRLRRALSFLNVLREES